MNIEKQLWGIRLLFILSLMMMSVSCQKDDESSIELLSTEVVHSQSESTARNVSADDIPEIMNYLASQSDGKGQFSIHQKNNNRSNESDLVIGELQTREILEVSDQYDRRNYTFLLTSIESVDETVQSTFNLIIKESSSGLFSYITEYRPDANWIPNYRDTQDFSTFSGEILHYSIDGSYIAKLTLDYGVASSGETRNPCPPDGDSNNDTGNNGGNEGNTDGNTDGGDTGDGTPGGEDNTPGPDVEAALMWLCNHRNQLHNTPSECNNPAAGGTWVVVITYGDKSVEDTLRCPDVPDLPVDCHQDNTEPCPYGCNADGTGCAEAPTDTDPNPNIGVILEEDLVFEISEYLESPLTHEQENYLILNNEIAEEFLEFLQNNFSESEKANYNRALLTVITDVEENPTWIPNTGVFKNRQALSYTHKYNPPNTEGTMYLLENGSVLYESVHYRAINPEDLSTIAPSDGSIEENYHYLYDYNSSEWYEYLLPSQNFDCLSCDIDAFFQAAIYNGGILLGRYILPLEDIIILVTGEDFDGVKQSRAVAGAFLMVDLIPGSELIKFIRLTKYGDEVIDATQAVVRYLDEIASSQKRTIENVLNGIIDLNANGNTIRKGNFGEMVTDVDFVSNGYEAIHVRRTNIDQSLDQGIDGVFKNPETGEFLIVESKYNTSTLGNTIDGKQMSDSWILGLNSGNNRLFQEVGEELGEEIMDAGYTRVISRVLPDGSQVYSELNELGNIIGVWIP